MVSRHVAFLAAVLSLAFAAGCGGQGGSNGNNTNSTASASAAPSETIHLGISGPFSGGGAAFGEMIWGAARVVEKEIEAAGGIKIGDKTYGLKFEKEDDQGKNDQAAIVANKLAANPKVFAIVGHFNSACSLAAKPIYRDAKLPSISPGSTNVTVCAGSDYMFRNLYRDDYQGEFLAMFAKDTLKAAKVGVFFDNDDYGIGLKDAFVAKAKAIGLEVIGEEAYTREQTMDFSASVDKFAAAKPDAIFISGLYQEAAMIAKKAREKGLTIPLLAGDGVDSPGLVEQAGRAAEGVLVTSPFVFRKNDEAAKSFAQAFAERNGKNPDTWAALTYDAIRMFVDAVKAVGADRQKVRDWLATHDSAEKGWKGVTGNTYFDANGDCLKPAFVKVVKDGRFVPYGE